MEQKCFNKQKKEIDKIKHTQVDERIKRETHSTRSKLETLWKRVEKNEVQPSESESLQESNSEEEEIYTADGSTSEDDYVFEEATSKKP